MNHGTRVQPVQDRHQVAVIRGDDRGEKCTPLISTVYILNESQHICWFCQNTEIMKQIKQKPDFPFMSHLYFQ